MIDKNKMVDNLMDRFIKIIGSQCEHDLYCQDKECQFNGMVICKVEQEYAAKIAIEYCNGRIEEARWFRPNGFKSAQEREQYWIDVSNLIRGRYNLK